MFYHGQYLLCIIYALPHSLPGNCIARGGTRRLVLVHQSCKACLSIRERMLRCNVNGTNSYLFDYMVITNMSNSFAEPREECRSAFYTMIKNHGTICFHCHLPTHRGSHNPAAMSPDRLIHISSYTHEKQRLVPSCVVDNYLYRGCWTIAERMRIQTLVGTHLRIGEEPRFDPMKPVMP